MASENEAQPETESEEVDTKENEVINVEEGTDKTEDGGKELDTNNSNIGEPDTHDETQEYMEEPDRIDSKEAEPYQPAADTETDMKTSSKMSMEISTQKRMTVEQSTARKSSLPKSEVKYDKSKDKFAGLAKSALGSIIDIRHLGESGPVGERRMVRYGNTYRMEAENPFNPGKVDKILKKVIEETLENLTYDVEKCSNNAKWAATAIRAKVKKLNFDRYKIICLVTIGEKHSQDVLATCRFLWDAEKDGYAAVALENTYVFGFALCFGLYYE